MNVGSGYSLPALVFLLPSVEEFHANSTKVPPFAALLWEVAFNACANLFYSPHTPAAIKEPLYSEAQPTSQETIMLRIPPICANLPLMHTLHPTFAHLPLMHTFHPTFAHHPLMHTFHSCTPSTPLLHTFHSCIPSTHAHLLPHFCTPSTHAHLPLMHLRLRGVHSGSNTPTKATRLHQRTQRTPAVTNETIVGG